MEKGHTWDNWLRPAGAIAIVLFGLLCISLSFVMREGNRDEKNIFSKILFSASTVENWFYDMRSARFYKHGNKSPNLVILEIDDESLNKVGRWPWTRTKHAKVLNNLAAYGARVVMFDVTFPEPESDAADKSFADSIVQFSKMPRHAVVLGYSAQSSDPSLDIKVPDELQVSAISGSAGAEAMGGYTFLDKNNFTAPALLSFDAAYGFISVDPDIDGVFRHYKLVFEKDKTFFPALGFSAFNSFYSDGKAKKIVIEPLQGSNEYILKMSSDATEKKIQLSSRGEIKLRFHGDHDAFTRVPIHQVALDDHPENNNTLKQIFNDKTVLIGSSAFGAHDLRHTPVDPLSPGMYMHANFFHALDQNLLFRPEDESMLATFILFILGIVLVYIFTRFKEPLIETGGTLFVAGSLYATDYFYFAPEGYNIRLFFCIVSAVNLFGWYTILNVFKEAKEKKKIKDTFQRYVAPEIVKEMLANPEKLKLGGIKKDITMIFSDVRDFTTLSERLTPAELSTLLNIYMGKMTDILFETQGTLDKYIGDALVGFWGAPLDIPDHAYHAVRGAKLMLEALPEVNKEFERRKFPKINVGIGLNSGEVSVGNMGSDRIFQYTALGDNMNLASRLEGLTKPYGVNLLISEFTLEKLGDKKREFIMRPLDSVQVKGKSKAVKIYEVIPNWSPWAKEDALLGKYTDAYENKYLKRKFDEAIVIFNHILTEIPHDKATERLLHSAEEFLKNPPPENWDGVTIFTTK